METPYVATGYAIGSGAGGALTLAILAFAAVAFTARADAYIYWANDASPSPSVVGRANLDGTHVIHDFIPSANIT